MKRLRDYWESYVFFFLASFQSLCFDEKLIVSCMDEKKSVQSNLQVSYACVICCTTSISKMSILFEFVIARNLLTHST